MQIPSPHLAVPLACVEVGGGSIQTVVFDNGTEPRMLEGAHQPPGAVVAVAVPGVISGGVVREASNLGWKDADPIERLGLEGPALVVLNDAEAAALGEAALRSYDGRLVFIAIGTGIGGAVVDRGRVLRTNLFGHDAPGHGRSFGDRPCPCGRSGCLETEVAGWALPDPLDARGLERVGRLLAEAIASHELAATGLVVVGGGISRRYEAIVDHVRVFLHGRPVEATRAPIEAKSAAAWGLRSEVEGATR
ncbi:MAG: ROK family protein [Actinomycetota bacterium]